MFVVIRLPSKCGDEVEEVIDFAERSVMEISVACSPASSRRVGEFMVKVVDRLEERQNNKAIITGVPSGIVDLDRMTAGFQKSELVILAKQRNGPTGKLNLTFIKP